MISGEHKKWDRGFVFSIASLVSAAIPCCHVTVTNLSSDGEKKYLNFIFIVLFVAILYN